MSEKTEARALLSEERIAKVTNWHARLLANYEKQATDETINAAGLGGIGVLLDDMADLLADRTAYRQQVAAELRLLLTDPAILPQLPPEARTACFLRNTQVNNAPKALQIDLTSAP